MTFLDGWDTTHRYAPTETICRCKRVPVTAWILHPAGHKVDGCPLYQDIPRVEMKTPVGSRWYGCRDAYINAELRFVIVGHSPRDEVRQSWEIVPENLTVTHGGTDS